MIEYYLSKFNDTTEECIVLIGDFLNDESVFRMKQNEASFLVIFPTNEDIVELVNDIVAYICNNKFSIVGGKCNVKIITIQS